MRQKENEYTVKIKVDTTELDEAIKKASQLKDLLLEIDLLSCPIIEKLEVFKKIV